MGGCYAESRVLGVLWFLFALIAALIATRLVGRPSFWRTEAPALSEVLGVWFILTLVVGGSLIGLSEMLIQIWAGQNPVLLAVR